MNNQDTNQNRADTSIYLVTQAVDTSSIGNEKVSSDLDVLKKAEEKSTYKANIVRGIKDPQIKRAVSALKLANPFKGY